MTIRELYAKYNELEDKTEESVWKMFDGNVQHRPANVTECLAAVRELIDTCTKVEVDEKNKETGFAYLNQAIVEIARKVAMVFALTDIEGGEGQANEDGNYYDMLTQMGLVDYLWERNPRAAEMFQEMYFAEMDVFNAKHSSARYINYYMKNISDRFSALADSATRLLDSVEKFDPKQIEEVQKVLANMNDSVKEVSKIVDMK